MGHDAEPFDRSLCWLLSRASYTLTTRMTAAMERLGLSPRAQSVLSAAADGERSQIELARAVGLDKTTMVVTLDELERAGLAERRRSAVDRRAQVVKVTAAGRRKLRDAHAIAARVHEEVLAELPEREREVFLDALATLVRGGLSEPVACTQTVRRRAPRAHAPLTA